MLTNTCKVVAAMAVNETVEEKEKPAKPEPRYFNNKVLESDFVDDMSSTLTKAIGLLSTSKTTHYYSYGNFNLVRVMIHIMKQTGPVHAFMSSYSFSQKSIEQLLRKREIGELLSFKLVIDNRVKTMSPLPFQLISTSFDYSCTSIHAKVALLWNDNWNITILTSQNATDNPKMERGAIYTDKSVFNFDYNALKNEFNRGST